MTLNDLTDGVCPNCNARTFVTAGGVHLDAIPNKYGTVEVDRMVFCTHDTTCLRAWWPARPWESSTLLDYVEKKRQLWIADGKVEKKASQTWYEGEIKHAGQVEYVNASLTKLDCVEKDGDRYAILQTLFMRYGNITTPSSCDLWNWQASFVIDWLGARSANDYQVTGAAQVEARRLMGQLDLVTHEAFKAATREEYERGDFQEEV